MPQLIGAQVMTSPLNSSDVFCAHQHVVTREIVGETLLVPISADLADLSSIFALNDTGAFVWQQLDGERTLAEVCAAMVEAFEVEAGEAWRDVADLIGELSERELVQRVV